jgi:hypothetical protein
MEENGDLLTSKEMPAMVMQSGGLGPWKCLYIGNKLSWFAVIAQWVNNSGNLKELRS